ncbi:fasciclin-like arabinogalactan protein 14 [Physcomitrium patens]|uniref:FAS1 domain-containing protein n=1 Tax=Physcomitrium patens TaxID=3218 RepID=A0A2K1KNS3_PHYPA|nr:fasciclin-like arabinogalactan protein 3 [Physcomitrium patens]PNR55429.1 hypothetical protein PHYPA_006326 [Physcomitrium patens]|eukprot:XP_024372390.1 fasciclin-like arabinogalactan protein 3 [Physcomitrella patens]
MGSSKMLVGLLALIALAVEVTSQDCTTALNEFPQFSMQKDALISSGVADALKGMNTLTLLLINNGAFGGYLGGHSTYTPQMVSDVLKYHILLSYFDTETIKTVSTMNDGVVTTLYQSTGRANGMDGFVNITVSPTDGVVTIKPSIPGSTTQATVVSYVKAVPYNCSYIEISNVLEPIGLAAAQLAPTSPPSPAPVAVPAPATVAPTTAPISTPTTAPASAPVESPTAVPASAPVDAPASAPSNAPVDSPVSSPPAPVEAPAETPVETPSETPVSTPPAASIEGPAMSPQSPDSSAYSLRLNLATLLVSAFLGALFL